MSQRSSSALFMSVLSAAAGLMQKSTITAEVLHAMTLSEQH